MSPMAMSRRVRCGKTEGLKGGDISGQGGVIMNSHPELVFWKYYRLTLYLTHYHRIVNLTHYHRIVNCE